MKIKSGKLANIFRNIEYWLVGWEKCWYRENFGEINLLGHPELSINTANLSL
jgi:hypothetical protein